MGLTTVEAKAIARQIRRERLAERIHDLGHPKPVEGCEECAIRHRPLTVILEKLDESIAEAVR